MNRTDPVVPILILALTGLFLALPAVAQQPQASDEEPPAEVRQPPPVVGQEHPLMALIGSSVTWDNNVFHLPTSVDPQPLLGTPTKPDRSLRTYRGPPHNTPCAHQRSPLALTDSTQPIDT